MKYFNQIKDHYYIGRYLHKNPFTSFFYAIKCTKSIYIRNKDILTKLQCHNGFLITNYLSQKSFDRLNNILDMHMKKAVDYKYRQISGEQILSVPNIKEILVQFEKENMKTNFNTILIKLNETMNKIKNNKETAKIVKTAQSKDFQENLNKNFVYYLSLYHQSMQNLVEGQREVTKDVQFKFENGETVEDKMNKFDKFFRSKIPKFNLKNKIKLNIKPFNDKSND